MKRIVLILLCIFILCGCNVNEKEASGFNSEEIIKLYSNIWRIVKNYYGHNDAIENWDEIYQKSLTRALTCNDEYEQWEIFEEFLAQIQDSHLIFYDEKNAIRNYAGCLPFSIEWIEDGYYVNAISRECDIPLMSQLTKIEKVDTSEYLEEHYKDKIIDANSLNKKEQMANRFMYDRINKSIHLTFKTPDGSTMAKEYIYNQTYGAEFTNKINYFQKSNHEIELRSISRGGDPIWAYNAGNNVIYVYITNMTKGCADQFKEIIEKYPTTQYSYLIDTRGNVGGSGAEVEKIFAFLIGEEIGGLGFKEYFQSSDAYYLTRAYNRTLDNTTAQKIENGTNYKLVIDSSNTSPLNNKKCNIVVLCDRYNYSAGELFVAYANELGIMTIGENTFGAIGGTVGDFMVNDTIKLTMTVGRLVNKEEKTLHNKGVVPTKQITQKVEDVLDEIDTIFVEGYHTLLNDK